MVFLCPLSRPKSARDPWGVVLLVSSGNMPPSSLSGSTSGGTYHRGSIQGTECPNAWPPNDSRQMRGGAEMVWTEFAPQVFVALLLGMVIGVERQWRQRMAGLRTNALVAVGAALYVSLSLMSETDSSPTRIAASVVSGIGFLGAGVIMRQGMNIQGLNTAATLWCSAAIGVLCGSGFVIEASIGTVVVLNANILLRSLQSKIGGHRLDEEARELSYTLRLVCSSEDENHIRSLLLYMLENGPLALASLSREDSDSPLKTEVSAVLLVHHGERQRLEQIVGRLSLERSVSAISFSVSDC